MAAGNTDAHDLAPVCGEDAMYVSTNQHVYKFDCAAEKFLDVEIFQQNTIKSISTGPEGYSTIVMRPTSGGSNWWSAEVCDMKATGCSTAWATRFTRPAGMWRIRSGIPRFTLCKT